jgi:hypothetical protein
MQFDRLKRCKLIAVVGGVAAAQGVCWYSWREQTTSLERLLQHRFEWVFAGHAAAATCRPKRRTRGLRRWSRR